MLYLIRAHFPRQKLLHKYLLMSNKWNLHKLCVNILNQHAETWYFSQSSLQVPPEGKALFHLHLSRGQYVWTNFIFRLIFVVHIICLSKMKASLPTYEIACLLISHGELNFCWVSTLHCWMCIICRVWFFFGADWYFGFYHYQYWGNRFT